MISAMATQRVVLLLLAACYVGAEKECAKLLASMPERPAGFVGQYVPQCDDNGEFRAVQFHPSTGYSWCVDSQGHEVPGSRTPPSQPPPQCPTIRTISSNDDVMQCPERFVRCRSENICIPQAWMCDGDVDCNDGSDENHCTTRGHVDEVKRMDKVKRLLKSLLNDE